MGGADEAACLALAEWLTSPGERACSSPELEAALERADPDRIRTDLAKRFPGTEPAFLAHELLIAAADIERRSRRGVYTTPAPLADHVVAGVDRALREELGLADGLADRTTWAELAARHGFDIPGGVDPDSAFVRIVDPATGSGVFLASVLRRMRVTLGEHWRDFAATELAERLVGFELLDAPRSLARANLARVMRELDGPDIAFDLRGANPLTSTEVWPAGVTVVLGNPPWSIRSGNLEPAARALVEPYKHAAGERVVEKGALRLEMHLQDDYVKFVRLAELAIERAGVGVVGLVTSNGYLDARTLRGMRASLCATFSRLWILDLSGSRLRRREDAAVDESLFGIDQGTSVVLGSRVPGVRSCVTHGRLSGTRREKLDRLADGTAQDLATHEIRPTSPSWFFVPRRRASPEYASWPGLAELFPRSVSGIVTAHDRLVVDFDDAPLRERAALLLDPHESVDDLRARLRIRDNAGWKLERARERFREAPDLDLSLRDYAYRPFDTRRILYHRALVFCDRRRLMRHLDGVKNVALVVCRQLAAPPWRHVFASRRLVDDNLISNRSRERSHCFPLLVGEGDGPLVPNVDADQARRIVPDADTPAPDLLAYVYAVLHAPGYRAKHEDELAVDFPRIPPPRDARQFRAFAALGRELLGVHLGDTPVARQADVPPEVLDFRIGAYAPARKWKKDRAGRELTADDLASYADLVGRVRATIDVVRRISEVAQ